MFDTLTAPAMAAPPVFPTFSELVHSIGLVKTSKELSMSNNTLVKRMKDPSTFTITELLNLAKLTEADFLTTVSRIGHETNPELFPRKGALAPPQFKTIAELIDSFGGRYSTASELDIAPNTLATRMRKPESFMLKELVAIAKKAGLSLLAVAELTQRQINEHLPPPAPKLGRPPFKHTSDQ